MPSVNFRLLLVTDREQTQGRSLLAVLRDAIQAGLQAVQIRERGLSTLELVTLTKTVQGMSGGGARSLLVNDRIDLVLALNLEGVHLRSDSLPVSVARRLLGPQRLVGVSTHSLEDVRDAVREGADYVVFGPIFDTPSKKEFGPPLGLQALEAVCREASIPVFAIGGITAPRIPAVRHAGAHGVAVIAAILTRRDTVAATSELLLELSRPSLP